MKKILKIIGIIFSTILLVPLFVLELVLIANIILNTLVSSDNLTETLEQLMTYNNRNSATLITYASENTYGSIVNNGKINYSTIKGKLEEYLVNAGIDQEDAKEIVNDEEFKEIVTDYLESVVLNKIKDSEIKYPSKQEIKKFVEKNYSTLKKIDVINKKYNEDNIDELVDDKYEEIKNTLAEVEQEVDLKEVEEFVVIKEFININPYIIGLFILATIIIIMLFQASFYKWLLWVSIPTFLNGIIYSSVGLFGMRVITTLIDLNKYSDIIDPIAKKMSTLMIQYGIILIISTIVMLIIYSIIKNKLKKKA